MATAKASIHIDAPADDVWAVLGDFNSLPKFARGVAESSVEGAGVGCVRTLTFSSGQVVKERLEKLDHQARALCYSIVEPPVPFENYRATVMVRQTGDETCEVHWGSTFDPKDQPEGPLVESFQKSYQGALKGLKTFFER